MSSRLIELIKKIPDVGVAKAAEEDARHIRVLNSAGALGVIILAFYDTFYFFLDLEHLLPLILANLGFSAAYLSVLFSNRFGWHRLAMVLLFAAAFSNITSATAFLGTSSGIQLIFIGLAAMALISVRADNHLAKVVLVVLSTILLILNHIYFETGLAPEYSPLVTNIIMSISIGATISLVVIPMALYQYYLEAAEKTVLEKEAILRTALENMSDGIYVLDDKLNFVMFNDRYLELTDLPSDAVKLGAPVLDAITAHAGLGDYGKGNHEHLAATRYAALMGTDSIEREMHIDRCDKILSLRKDSTENGGAVVILTDITARKKAEDEMQRERQRLQYILDTSPVGSAFATDGKLMFSNKQFTTMTGTGPGDATPDLYVDEADRDALLRGLAENGKVENYELKIRGAEQDFDALVTYFNAEFEGAKGILAWVVDISERKKFELRLRDAFDVISSSIDYASRIQRSVLPDANFLSSITEDHYVLWEPRDKVGGDIHWQGAWGEGCLVVLGDCTGHGVPGAFMTLIFIGALERAMSEIEGGNLGDLVTRVHQFIQVTLGQHFEGGDSNDGIELGAIYFVPDQPTMKFVGTRFELFIVDGEEVDILKGTKQGMGYRGIPYGQEYEEITTPIDHGKSYYLTTDGLIDQIGGEKRRMFGKRRFKELLLAGQGQTMEDQKSKIIEALIDYQGNEKRRDDISSIGFRF